MRIRKYNGRIVSVKITKRELQMVEDLWNQRFNANYKLNTKSNG
jgi:hypothetical protein